MLNEDSYVPFPYFYDVSARSYPLLSAVAGGWTGRHLDASAARVPLVAQPPPPKRPANLPRIGIIDQGPEPDYRYQTTGWLQWRLARTGACPTPG